MNDTSVVRISNRQGVNDARRAARLLAVSLGFSRNDVETVALVAGELAMNLHRYALAGEIMVEVIGEPDARGIRITSRDTGPGIPDVEAAMRDGFTTGGGLGSGLPAARRLMDTFELVTGANGTTITACKWRTSR
jgi:anti-sigma regulatory factor (Ser/Thr protein kinase)